MFNVRQGAQSLFFEWITASHDPIQVEASPLSSFPIFCHRPRRAHPRHEEQIISS